MTIAAELASFARQRVEHAMPAEARTMISAHIQDTVGACIAAAAAEPPVTRVVRGWGGTAQATAIGLAERVPGPSAGLVNGTLAHSLELDDSHIASLLHPSASIVPAALACAETYGRRGPTVPAAIWLGTEVCLRLGMAGVDVTAGNSVFFDRGSHATSICGAVGAAVAAGLLAGFDERQLAHAIAITASLGSGLLEANRTGGTVKPVHTGWAAHAALSAIDLVREGLTGPPTAIEGRFGFLNVWCGDQARPEVVLDHLGQHWYCAELAIKPYPCNHFTHAAVDAALELRRGGIELDDIVAIELGVPEPVLRTIAEPAEVKATPPNGYAARFSGPYVVAAALTGGGGLGVWLDDFTDEAVTDPVRRRIASMVTCRPDDECGRSFPARVLAVLTVTTRSGRRTTVRTEVNRGGPEAPLREDELAQKFDLLVRGVLGDASDTVRSALRDLDTSQDTKETMALIRNAIGAGLCSAETPSWAH